MTVPVFAVQASSQRMRRTVDMASAHARVVRTVSALTMCLAWTACSVAGPSAALRIEERQDFSLRTGETAQTRDGSLQVGFDGVVADSRCPKGEQCIRAGDATARVWVRQGAAPKETRDLHSAPVAAQSTRVVERSLRLVRLDPIAITGKPIAQADYVATLRLSRDSADEAEK